MYVDTHCHLCPALDDGPQTTSEALAMCEIAWREGIRTIACTAHQNDRWPANTPQAIKDATVKLAAVLNGMQIPLTLVPVGEVMISEHTWDDWREGRLLSYGDLGKYILLEMPHGLFLDICGLACQFCDSGVKPVLAHAERYPELLFGGKLVDDFIRHGCVIQVSSGAIADSPDRRFRNALRDWAERGVIHVLGSDAHSPRRRRPVMQAAYTQLARWIGNAAAETIICHNGDALLLGQTIVPIEPQKRRKKLFGLI